MPTPPVRRSLSFASLLTVLALLLTALPGARVAGAQPAPAIQAEPVLPGSPFWGPRFDPRPLEQQQTAQAALAGRSMADLMRAPTGGEKPAASLAAAPVRRGAPDDAALTAAPEPAAARADKGRKPGAPSLPTTPLPAAAGQGAGLQAVQSVQLVTNPQLNDTDNSFFPDDWFPDVRGVYRDSEDFASAPYAVFMQDNDTSNEGPISSTVDIDMFSTAINIPSTVISLTVQSKLRFFAVDPGFDVLRYGFATYSSAAGDPELGYNRVIYEATLPPGQVTSSFVTFTATITDPAVIDELRFQRLQRPVYFFIYQQGDKLSPSQVVTIDDVTVTASYQPRADACEQLVANPAMTDRDGSGAMAYYQDGWFPDIPNAYFDRQFFTSGPNAIYMQDGDQGDDPEQMVYHRPDIDMISTRIDLERAAGILGNVTELTLNFNLQYLETDPNYDYLYYGFVTYDYTNGDPDYGYIGEVVYLDYAPDFEAGAHAFHQVSTRINDPAIIKQLLDTDASASSGVWLVFYNYADGIQPYIDVTVDDATVIACNHTGAINGKVRDAALPAASADLLLGYTGADGSYDVVQRVATNASGDYSFAGLPALATGATYQPFYLNDGSDDSHLGWWLTPPVANLDNTPVVQSPFDLANIRLLAPSYQQQLAFSAPFTATFTWTNRGIAGEKYHLCFYDPADNSTFVCSTPIQPARVTDPTVSATIDASFFDPVPEFGFRLGVSYPWYVIVEGPGGASVAGTGASFYESAVTFVAQAPPPDVPSPAAGGSVPPAANAKDWTVMVYMAGDNSLSDTTQYPDRAVNLRGQFDILKGVARNYSNFNVVTLTDFLGNEDGTQFCHLPSTGSPICQQLGERNSADPALLTRFIVDALDRFPARHTMLVIAGHGNFIGGIGPDVTTAANEIMSPDEIRKAFTDAGLGTARPKLDVLFYYACLMGSFEMTFESSSFAHYMVASADLIWVINPFNRIFAELSRSLTAADPARQAAIGVVKAYEATVRAANLNLFISSAAYDLAQVSPVLNALSALSQAMTDDLTRPGDQGENTLNNIRARVQVFDASDDLLLSPAEDAYADIYHVALLLSAGAGDPDVSARATDLLQVLPSLVIASSQISGGNGANGTHTYAGTPGTVGTDQVLGLSVFFPVSSANQTENSLQKTMLHRFIGSPAFSTYNGRDNVGWDDMLIVFTKLDPDSILASGAGRIASGAGRIASGGLTIEGLAPPGSVPSPCDNCLYLPLVRK